MALVGNRFSDSTGWEMSGFPFFIRFVRLFLIIRFVNVGNESNKHEDIFIDGLNMHEGIFLQRDTFHKGALLNENKPKKKSVKKI